MTEGVFSGQPIVKIEGTELSQAVSTLIESLVIDDHLQLPDQLTIVLRDPMREVFTQGKITIGAKIEVGVVSTGRGASDGDVIFQGEITGLEGDYGVAGQRVTVRAYDYSHRLHRGRRTEAYPNIRDSDVARKLAQQAGLKLGQVDDSEQVHDYVSQINLTDWEFLKSRAREIGFEVGVNDGKFTFKKVKAAKEEPLGDYKATGALQLTFGSDLLEFRPRVSAAAQVKDVVARGWSYKDKREVIGRTTTAACNSAPRIALAPTDVANKFPTEPYTVTDRALATQQEADNAAKGTAHQISAALGEAEGVARGNTKIRAGAALAINLVAECFVGTWTVTNSRHVFHRDGYRTQFTVTGRQERSMLGLTSAGATSGVASAGGPPIYGVVVGLVSNIKDPENLSRIRLTFPWLSDKYETDWVRLAMPGAGKSRGMMWLPEVGDEVLVVFEQGDVRRPYAIGALFNGKDKWEVGQYTDSGVVKKRGWRSSAGHTVGFHENQNGRSGIFIRSANEKLQIKLNETGSTIEISSNGSVKMTGSDITVDASNSLTLKAKTDLKISALNVSVKADTMVDIDGAMITLN